MKFTEALGRTSHLPLPRTWTTWGRPWCWQSVRTCTASWCAPGQASSLPWRTAFLRMIIFMRLWQEQVQRLYCTLDSDSSDEPTNTIPGTLAECEEREKVRILGEILWIKDCRIVEAIVALLLFHSFIKKSKVNNFSPLREGSISFSSVTYCLIETLKNQYVATLEHSSLVYIYWTRP